MGSDASETRFGCLPIGRVWEERQVCVQRVCNEARCGRLTGGSGSGIGKEEEDKERGGGGGDRMRTKIGEYVGSVPSCSCLKITR